MAEKLLRLSVITPEGSVLEEDVELVAAPGILGEFGVLYNHLPFLTSLVPGELRYHQGGKLSYLAVFGGYAEILSDRVTVLAEGAEKPEDIDIERAMAARKRAEERMAEAATRRVDVEYARARMELLKQITRIKIYEKYRPS